MRINAIWTHSAYPLSPFGAAGTSGSSTYCLASFLYCRASGRFDFILQEGVQFLTSLTKTAEKSTENAVSYRYNKAPQ
jgi:hypothetical protein